MCAVHQAKVVEQGGGGGGGWGDASWPGITPDLKPPSAATWNTPTDLNQTMMTSKKVSVLTGSDVRNVKPA